MKGMEDMGDFLHDNERVLFIESPMLIDIRQERWRIDIFLNDVVVFAQIA